MKAIQIIHIKESYADGFIEVVIWEVPEPVPPSEHNFKYRLVYIMENERVVGYDNERDKGDHKHIKNEEFPYTFISPAQLMADFMQDIEGLEP